MKYLQIICFLLVACLSLRAQTIEIHNSTGSSLDSLAARYNQKIVNYTDPANNPQFKAKNHCTALGADTMVMVCPVANGNITYKVYLADRLDKVLQLKADSLPAPNEIALYYQTFENRVYDLNKEPRPQRYMGVNLPEKLKKAIKNKQFDILDIVKMYEHNIFDMSRFSGTNLYFEIEEELKK